MIHSFSQDGPLIPANQSITTDYDIQQTNPLIQIHNPDSPDLAFAAKIAQELVNISGAEVKVYARTNSESYDEVYEEDPDPTYKRPKTLKAYFVPQPLAAQLTPWGVDVENQTTVVFNKDAVYNEFGERMIRIGDIIELPYNASTIKPDRYRVLNAFDSSNFRYSWLYWSCKVENITDDRVIDVVV